ncbi:MAG: cytochrome c oxidase subunit 3 [Planctomycetota bacterium]
MTASPVEQPEPFTRPDHHVSQKTQKLGMILFLISLGVLFASTMLVYVLVRLVFGTEQPEIGYMRDELSNWKLFLSTIIVLAASVTIHFSVKAIQFERREPFIRWLLITDVLAIAFVIVQIPAMMGILEHHGGSTNVDGQLFASPDRFFGVTMFLILLHALHVVGGIVYLIVVTAKAAAGGYDHENYRGVAHAALYWHFLDVIWILMFGILLALG